MYQKTVILKRLPNGTYVYLIGVIKLRTIGRVQHVTLVEQKRHEYRNLVEKPEGKKPLRKTRRGWEDNIKTDFK
jgi:hypothetical protein